MAAKLSEDIAAGLAEFLKSLPTPPKDGVTLEAKVAQKKRAAIKAKAHKTKRHAYYVVGRDGAYREGRLYTQGEVITLPVDEDPSHTFRPATAAHLGAAAAAEAKRSAEAAELNGADLDDGDDVSPPADDAEEVDDEQLDAAAEIDGDDAEDTDEEPEADAVEEPEEVDAPAPKRAKAGKATKPKAGKVGKAGRTSDRDVA